MDKLAVDLFAGIGGVTSGITQTGEFKVVSVERYPKHPHISEGYGQIHDLNFPDHAFINSSVQDWVANDYPGVDRDVFLLHSSPQCTNYRANKSESLDDVEAAMAIADSICHLNPALYTLEQVPQYLDSISCSYILSALSDYSVEIHKINLSHYGQPQDRDRLFIVANRLTDKPLGLQPKRPHSGWGSTFELNDPDALLMPTQQNSRRKRSIVEPFPTLMRSHFIEEKKNGTLAIRGQFYKYMTRGQILPVPFSALVAACGFPPDFQFYPDKPFNICNGAGIGNAFSPMFYRDFLKCALNHPEIEL